MKERYLSHPQDVHDFTNELNRTTLPLQVMVMKAVPEKVHETEDGKRKRMMAYFHRTICVAYAKEAGVNEQEAKYELLSKFGVVSEVMKDKNGAWDVVSLRNGRMFVFSDNKDFEVRPISNMPNDELSDFINQCKDYILQYYGVMVTNFNKNYKTK